MTEAAQVLVTKAAIGEAEVVGVELSPLDAGQVRLKVDSFAVTANNVTYAAIGDAFGYWDFFPTGDASKGIVPMWGHATVVESLVDAIAVGERVYGYLPMATHLVVEPTRIAPTGFVDGASHRAARAAVYNQYRRLAADPGHHPDREDVRMVFEPLFTTSFLIEAMFRRAGWHGARRLVMTSASSKTAMALAHVARAASPAIERIGLTSARNIGFVERTGLYDRVLGYDEVEELGGDPSVAVDFAGNGATLASVHRALGDALAYSCLVGLTDWQHRGGFGTADLPGPKPILFFAPDHMAASLAELGPKGFQEAIGTRWRDFAADASALVKIEPVEGLAAARDAFVTTVEGRARPDAATVVRLD